MVYSGISWRTHSFQGQQCRRPSYREGGDSFVPVVAQAIVQEAAAIRDSQVQGVLVSGYDRNLGFGY
jgi:hypothetical protein